MSLTPHPRKERPHGSKKVPARSSAGKSSLSRAVSEYPFAADPQGSVRTQRGRTSSDNGPRTFTRGIAVLFAGAVWASMSKSTKDEWLSLVKDGKGDEEEGLMQAQYMMDTLTTTTTTSTAYGPIPRMDGSYMVERVVQSESSRQQIVYLASEKVHEVTRTQ